MARCYEVCLYSEEFGAEVFAYDCEEEQVQAAVRLTKSARKSYKEDGIERQVRILIGDWEREEEAFEEVT